jgi:prepilin-type N-terminal cleavage/methylation domain-containing protein
MNDKMQNKYHANWKNAFTLAEILIVIGVIGIVSALTIPNLITKYQKRATVSKLKIAYSIFSQALRNSIAENGDVSGWNITTRGIAPTYLNPYLKVIGKVKPYTMYSLYPNGIWLLWDNSNIYVLENGMTFTLLYDQGVISLTVDINGTKGPNVLGIDGFEMRLIAGYDNIRFPCESKTREKLFNEGYGACSRNGKWFYYNGECCTALIVKDGWQIKADYPWENGGRTLK